MRLSDQISNRSTERRVMRKDCGIVILSGGNLETIFDEQAIHPLLSNSPLRWALHQQGYAFCGYICVLCTADEIVRHE